jgi:hypothetical protein
MRLVYANNIPTHPAVPHTLAAASSAPVMAAPHLIGSRRAPA